MARRIAILTDALEHLAFEHALAWCAERGVDGVEVGVGGYSACPHADPDRLLGSVAAREAFIAALGASRLELVALNASGNPLHPDRRLRAAHDGALRGSIQLAAELGVERVVAMSGCPGGPGGGSWPVFAGGAWLPDMEGLWASQWEIIAPYWSALSAWAATTAPGVVVCLELHPGTSIYNAASFARLRSVVGENVAVNLDPSHFWWQGIDPVATVAALGGSVRFAHAKDTILHPERVALDGVLDFRWPSAASEMPWHFGAVGAGRPIADWAALLAALESSGYHGPLSIEHEDPNLTPEAGIEASIAGLRAAFELMAPADVPPGMDPT